jgi:hypothetical protein
MNRAEPQKRHPLEIVGFIEAAIFGCLWFGAGLAIFIWSIRVKADYDLLQQRLRDGTIAPTTLYVQSLEDKGDNHDFIAHGSGNWIVRFANSDGRIVLRRFVKNPNDFPVGSAVSVLPFNGSYIIPKLGEGNNFVAAWIFLVWGLMPWLCVAGYFTFKKFRRRRPADISSGMLL